MTGNTMKSVDMTVDDILEYLPMCSGGGVELAS